MTAGEQAVTDALALEDLARVARHLRAIGATARPARQPRRRASAAPASGVEGHDGHVWWVAGPDVEAVALGLEAKAGRPDDRARATGSALRPLPSPADHGPVRLAVVDPDERKLRLARMVVATGEPWRGGDDVWFVPGGMAHGAAGGGRVAFLLPAAAPVPAGPSAYELLALARWLGIEATGPMLVDAALRRLGASPDVAATAHPGHAAHAAGPDHDAGPARATGVAQALYDAGTRVFVDIGQAQGDLARTLARALDGRDHVAVTALTTGARPLARLDRALAALWAEGVPVLPDALHRPLPTEPGPAWAGRSPIPTSVATTPPRYEGDT
jgi:hypothetical protein